MLNNSDSSFLCHQLVCAAQAKLADELRPSVLMRPKVYPDGNKWCALYGDDLMMGVAGFGDTPEKACAAFDLEWHQAKLPEPKP